jgi:hypothetical protein
MKHKLTMKKQRGVALITALLMTVIFLALIGALMAQMIGELQDVGAHSNSAKALDAAYAGVENMVLEIEENASGPGHVAPAPINYSFPSPSTVSYSSSVTTTWNSTSGLVYYEVTSTGTEGTSGLTRTVQALVRSFPYSYYEQFTAGNSGNIYYVTGEKFDGPVYNGGTMNVWYQDPGTPIFNNSVTTVTQPSWFEGAGKTAVLPANVKWGDVMTGGSTNFKVGTNPMQLPTFKNNLAVSSEAYYGDSTHTSALPAPGAKGLFVNTGTPATTGSGLLKTGLYIEGNATITPSSPGANNEVFTIAPNGLGSIPATYTVTVDFGAGTTTIAQTIPAGATATYTGTLSGQPISGSTAGNGSIFVDGNVLLKSGTIHGDYSITVPDYTTDHGHTITLNGTAPGVVYKDQSSTSTDEFGIWANDIKVIGSNTTTGYEFDGSILTGYYGECPPCTDGNFSNTTYNSTLSGTFTFYGGLIQNINGAMGISSGGSLQHGFDRKYKYDARLAANPPPGFPITNRYDIIAWLDEGH